MATYLGGGLRKLIADFHRRNPNNNSLNRLTLGTEIERELSPKSRLSGLTRAIKESEAEAEANPTLLDRDELVYRAVEKVIRDNEPSDWVLPDPDANWNSHVPFATPNFI